jgi:altronate dehydratase small subunit
MKGDVVGDAALVMQADDTVATALDDLPEGRELEVDSGTITIAEPVRFGHKVALRSVPEGAPVRKYGEVIGTADRDIESGEWVHTHNCRSTRGRGDIAAGDATGGDRA